MQIIPAINCQSFDCVAEKIKKSADFGAEWVQIDIADGKFTPHKTWDNSSELISNLNTEIHLMVENPEIEIDKWLNGGVKRIIVHFEAIKNSALKNPANNNEIDIVNFILGKCTNNRIELGLAINPNTSAEELLPYLDKIKFIQVLAVDPGLSGQEFQKETLGKISFLEQLKKQYFDIVIEVDGGINLETAKMCKEAGADILVAGSYIWNSENPKGAFEKLDTI